MQSGFPPHVDAQLHPSQQYCTDWDESLQIHSKCRHPTIQSRLFCLKTGISCHLRCFGVSKGLVWGRQISHRTYEKLTSFWRLGGKSQGTSGGIDSELRATQLSLKHFSLELKPPHPSCLRCRTLSLCGQRREAFPEDESSHSPSPHWL